MTLEPRQTTSTEPLKPSIDQFQLDEPIAPSNELVQSLPAIPDGGLLAWTQVLGSWVLFFNTFGLINTFGIYQTFYESGQLFSASSSNISWIGSIQALTILCVGALTGPIYDAGWLRTLLVVGSFGVVFGHMMLSLSHEYWQVLLTQGVTIGLGASCLFIPGIAVLPGYFQRHIGLAVGLAVSGSSFGTSFVSQLLSTLAYRARRRYRIPYSLLSSVVCGPFVGLKLMVWPGLIAEIGFPWAVRTLGFMALLLLTVPVSCLRMRTKPSARRALLDTSAFTDISFLLFTAACVIGYCGLYVTIFYASFYGENQHILSSRMAFYLVPILNAASVLGRTVPNWLSDHFGPLNIMAPSAMIMGVLTFCFIAADHAAALIALSVLYGAFSGVYLSLPGVVMFSITKDKTRIGTRVGMSFCAIGLGILAGGPGGGGILGSEPSPSDWEHAWTYAGVCALASSFVLFGLRFYRSGRRIMVKV